MSNADGPFLTPPENTFGTSALDIFLNGLMVFMMIAIMGLLFMHPEKEETPQAKDESDPIGMLQFQIAWPNEYNTDVDLWVLDPKGPSVGYSNKDNKILSLLKDDLGFKNDASGLNDELTVCRGTPLVGEYIVNAHLFENAGWAPLPITITLRVYIRKNAGESLKKIIERTVDLRYLGDERTIIRFQLDTNGNFIPGSVNNVQKPIRGRKN